MHGIKKLIFCKHSRNIFSDCSCIVWATKRINVPFFHLAIHRRRTILICIDRKDKGSQKQNTTQVQNQLSPQRAYSSKNKSPRCYDLIRGLSSFPEKHLFCFAASLVGEKVSHTKQTEQALDLRGDSSMHKSIIQTNKCQLNPHRV